MAGVEKKALGGLRMNQGLRQSLMALPVLFDNHICKSSNILCRWDSRSIGEICVFWHHGIYTIYGNTTFRRACSRFGGVVKTHEALFVELNLLATNRSAQYSP